MRKTIRNDGADAALAALAAGAAEAKTLKWGANREIVSLDPYSYGDTFTLAVLNHVYEGLVRYNDKLKIEPALATSWEIGIADGVALQAAPGRQLPQRRAVHRRRRASPRSSASATDLAAEGQPAGLQVGQEGRRPHGRHRGHRHLSAAAERPDQHLHLQTSAVAGQEQRHAADRCRQGRRGLCRPTTPTAPARSRSKSRKPDAATVFVVNPNWWDKPRHNLTRIEFLPIASAATRVAALLSGEIDFTNVAPLQDLPRLAGVAGREGAADQRAAHHLLRLQHARRAVRVAT